MRKAIGLIIFGLLLNGCASNIVSKDVQGQLVESGTIKIGMDYNSFSNILGYDGRVWLYPLKESTKEYVVNLGYNASHYQFVFQSTGNTGLIFNAYSYKLIKIFTNAPEMYDYLLTLPNIHPTDEVKLRKLRAQELKEINEPTATTGKITLASMIGQAKNTCKGLGYTEGTDKFVDCSFKLYSQHLELAASQNRAIQGSMSGGAVTIYDPVRDNRVLINQGMGMITGRCSFGYDC